MPAFGGSSLRKEILSHHLCTSHAVGVCIDIRKLDRNDEKPKADRKKGKKMLHMARFLPLTAVILESSEL
jgi:hypothetical protein